MEWSKEAKDDLRILRGRKADRPQKPLRSRSFVQRGKYLPIWLIAAHSNATESLKEVCPIVCEFTQPGTKLFLSDSVLLLRWREMPVCLRSYRGMSQFTLVEINPIGLGREGERRRPPHVPFALGGAQQNATRDPFQWS